MCGLSRQLLQVFTIYFNLLQSATAFFITKCDSFFITKCDKCYYKVRQVLQSVTILLQSATGITKCDDYYKVRQYMVTDRIGRHEVLLPINHNFNKICGI